MVYYYGAGEKVENVTIQLTDKSIGSLILETKSLPEDFPSRIKLRTKRGHKEFEYDIPRKDGDAFLRNSARTKKMFSISR